MKVKLWIYIENGGDGSAWAKFFLSKKEAESYAENDEERFCDDIYEQELEFDNQGQLIKK